MKGMIAVMRPQLLVCAARGHLICGYRHSICGYRHSRNALVLVAANGIRGTGRHGHLGLRKACRRRHGMVAFMTGDEISIL
jgi:hypothetical protein